MFEFPRNFGGYGKIQGQINAVNPRQLQGNGPSSFQLYDRQPHTSTNILKPHHSWNNFPAGTWKQSSL